MFNCIAAADAYQAAQESLPSSKDPLNTILKEKKKEGQIWYERRNIVLAIENDKIEADSDGQWTDSVFFWKLSAQQKDQRPFFHCMNNLSWLANVWKALLLLLLL